MASLLKERLLSVMDRKDHWAWPHFTGPGLTKDQLLLHFRHEYRVYVRDFPVLLGRALGLGPPEDVRIALAENIYEEQTGGLSIGEPHPRLFLEMMSGLGFSRSELESDRPAFVPEALAYRAFLDEVSARDPWPVGVAVLTIFVEGNRHERAHLSGTAPRPSPADKVKDHPLVVHYGCPPEKMRLVGAHAEVEGGHRDDAWRMILDHVPDDGETAEAVAEAVARSLDLWLAYRDGVAREMGLARPS